MSQGVEDPGRELRRLVEEEHPVVGQRRGPRPGHPAAPTDDRGDSGGVVRILVRRDADQGLTRGQRARDRVHGSDLQRRLELQWRQQARHALGHHGLARARRAEQEGMVSTGSGHLHRGATADLSGDVEHVERQGRQRRGRGNDRAGFVEWLAAEQGDQTAHGGDPVGLHPGEQPGLGEVAHRHDHPLEAGPHGGEHCWQDAADRPDPPVEAELPDEHPADQRRRGHRTVGRENRGRQRQVETAAPLG